MQNVVTVVTVVDVLGKFCFGCSKLNAAFCDLERNIRIISD